MTIILRDSASFPHCTSHFLYIVHPRAVYIVHHEYCTSAPLYIATHEGRTASSEGDVTRPSDATCAESMIFAVGRSSPVNGSTLNTGPVALERLCRWSLENGRLGDPG